MNSLGTKNLAKFFGHCVFVIVIGSFGAWVWIFLDGHFPAKRDVENNSTPALAQSMQPKQVNSTELANPPRIIQTTSSQKDMAYPQANVSVTINGHPMNRPVVEQDGNGQTIFAGDVEIHQDAGERVITIGNTVRIVQSANVQIINIDN